jgi:hypothetical protein
MRFVGRCPRGDFDRTGASGAGRSYVGTSVRKGSVCQGFFVGPPSAGCVVEIDFMTSAGSARHGKKMYTHLYVNPALSAVRGGPKGLAPLGVEGGHSPP